ncbi:NUDIX hydrolase [Kibdelosporangium aridum]|uniref:NUDIX hydrolase n=1 Tax=Kibdelosporangium aridum TaxID=2030 RepID=A0A428Z3A9_KIBAR|nr:NUDIX hydrolase [Kibdelosporangium aridum]RSM80452.1 NUDIX hydrolase [Kibdelosporangium aridum]
MNSTPKHSVSVAGVVIDDHDRVLTIKRQDNGHWEAPGGVLELGETFEQGVQREVVEETGMRVQVQHLTGVYKNLSRGIVALVFRCAPNGETVERTDEAREIRWMTLDEVHELMDPAFAIRVADAFRSQAVVRSHDGVNLISA